jgi:hypothetical protein
VLARRDRRRHLHDRRRRSCPASGHLDEPARSPGCRSPSVGLVSCHRRGSGNAAQRGKCCLKGH